MPLTQHLYELDEVVSAARLCLQNNWPRALFFIWELIVSGEEETAFVICQETWLEYGGGWDPTVIATLRPINGEEWTRLVQRVMRACGSANSLTAHRFLTETVGLDVCPAATSVKEMQSAAARATGWVTKLHPDESMERDAATTWFKGLLAATQAHTRRIAFWHLQAALPVLSADAIWSALTWMAVTPDIRAVVTGLQAATSPHPWRQALHQAAALLILCAPDETRADMLKSWSTLGVSLYQRDWVAWNAVLGRRAARIYPISPDALHAGTTRGQLSARYTNIDEVRDPFALLLDGCPCWREAAVGMGAVIDGRTGGLVFPSDDHLEAFADRYFPDDRPDEWSAADQQKSHGRGCAEKAPPAPQPAPIREMPL
jgi:hypothetical protein